MAGRWRARPALHADRPAAGFTPSRGQALALLAALVLVAAAVAVASVVVKPSKARAFDLFYGSVFLADERAPVAVDLASGKPTIRLLGANAQVSAQRPSNFEVVPLQGGTLLLNRATGEFNLVDASGFVVKTTGGGVRLPPASGPTRSIGIASANSAFVVQSGPGGTSVYLVGQTTVQSATGAGAKVTPRAFATMPERVALTAGAEAAADGDLWLLAGAGGTRTIRRLSVPRGSDAGVVLHSDDHGTVSGAAAIGVAARRADGSGGEVVGVASADSVQLLRQGARIGTVAVSGQAGADVILPASDQAGRLSFLYHTGSGWSLVSVRTDGTGRTGPTPVSAIGATTALATPAVSNGRLYTMDLGTTGQLWQIAPSGAATPVSGPGTYPTAKAANGSALEAAAFGDAYVLARGARVVFDSPDHVKALAVFTDGSRDPLTIDKSAATDLNASGGATALTKHLPGRQQADGNPRPKPAQQPAEPINNQINCKTTTQVPHIPTITQATPGSRSVQLLWTYPLLDPQDCAPSTYGVQVQLISADAPAAPAPLVVQGQNGVTIGKLFPSTRYRITVTAYLNGKGTPSQPIDVTTGPEGPAAPTNVRTAVDESGNWTITWNSCGGIAQGCVPTASWSILPSFCDGTGLSSPPATISVAGDPSQHTFTATYRGTDALLGRGLSFQVEGIGNQGTVGTPTSDHTCSYSWSHPIASAISLHASQPAQTTLGGSASTTVNLDLGTNPVRAQGGIGAQFTYQLLAGTTVISTKGPTSATSATFDGIAAGTQYSARAFVAPPRHPGAAVTVGPVPISTRAAWPAMSLAVTFASNPGQIIPLFGTLTVHINGLSSAAAGGERFDLTNSVLLCGSTGRSLERNAFDPAADTIVLSDVLLLQYHGSCTVSVSLVESAGTQHNPPVFGGTPSPTVSAAADLGGAPTLGAQQGDFAAAWDVSPDPRGRSTVLVRYTGKASQSELDQLTRSWDIEVLAPDGQACARSGATPSASGVAIPVDNRCLDQHGTDPTGGQWTVTISYQNSGSSGGAGPFTEQVTGQPPTYQPKTTPSPSPSPT